MKKWFKSFGVFACFAILSSACSSANGSLSNSVISETSFASGGETSGISIASDSTSDSKLSDEEKEQYLDGGFGKYNSLGVGRGIDVTKNTFIDVDSKYSVFDMKKLQSLSWTRTPLKDFSSYCAKGSSVKSFYDDLSVSYANKTSASATLSGAFTANLDQEFAINSSTTFTKKTQEIVVKCYQNIFGYEISVDGYADVSRFFNCLSSSLVAAAYEIESGALTADSFIKSFGTHVLLAGIYGGRVECNYQMINEDASITNETNASFQTKAAAALQVSASDAIGGKDETGFSIANKLGLSANSTSEYFTAVGKGGAAFPSYSLDSFFSGIGAWAKSFKEDEEGNSVLVDVPNESLAAIWDILPANTFPKAKKALQDTFDSSLTSAYNVFTSKFAHPVDEEKGTENDPYEVTNAVDFKSIGSKDGPSIYFKLMNDVDLKFSNTSIDDFKGHFDGNKKTISALNVTIPGTKFDGIQYFGLFKRNHGTISNLTVRNTSLLSSQNMQNGAEIFVGGLVGSNESGGIISDVLVDGCSFSVDRSGSTIGGICGLNWGSVSNCTVTNSRFYSNGDVGGIVGRNCAGGFLENVIFEGKAISGSAKDNENNVSFEYYLVKNGDNCNSKSWGGIVGWNLAEATIANISISNIYMYMCGDGGSFAPEMGYAIGHHAGVVSGTKTVSNIGEFRSIVPQSKNYYFANIGGLIGRIDNGSLVKW
jgi:hypothetical protein